MRHGMQISGWLVEANAAGLPLGSWPGDGVRRRRPDRERLDRVAQERDAVLHALADLRAIRDAVPAEKRAALNSIEARLWLALQGYAAQLQ